MAELKPCPFCGGKANLRSGFWIHTAYCRDCLVSITRDSEEEAIEAWNRRAEE